MKRLAILVAFFVFSVPETSLSVEDWQKEYLQVAEKIAATVERTAVDERTGMYLSFVDTELGAPEPLSRTHHANWYLPGLWMLYWRTGDPVYLEWIERHSNGLWKAGIEPGTGMPWMWYDKNEGGRIRKGVGHRIQYQVASYGNWDKYLRSLHSGVKYQIVSDGRGRRTVLDHIDPRRPEDPTGQISPDYFGCLDLRIPYAAGTIEHKPELYDVITDDFRSHAAKVFGMGTGLWSGILTVSPVTGKIKPLYVWSGVNADDTYTGLILADLTNRPEIFKMVEHQTDLALKHCYDHEGKYFYSLVDTLTGIPIDKSPKRHTNWEWALTFFILHEATGDDRWLGPGMDNYKWLIDTLDDPGNYVRGEGNDWNVMQIALLALFRYHQTGDEQYIADARRVADYLIEHRLFERDGNLYVGDDRQMDLREAGDFIAMLVCLSDPALPVISSRYFLYPVGIRSPVFPVFERAYVDAYVGQEDGSLVAVVKGGAGMVEDVWVMVMSREVGNVKLNGTEVNFEFTKIAGQGYIILQKVDLANAVIEVH